MNFKNRSTIKDVAHKAGVSVATVSRVLNNPSLVQPTTRQRVLKAIKDCQYIYNAVAGGLSSNRTKTLGVVVPTITNPVFATVTKGIQDYARGQGYSIILGNTDYNEENEKELIRLFQEKRTDGVILNGPWRDASIVSMMKRIRLPFVITWQEIPDKDVSYVAFDNFKSAYQVVEYLINLGHRSIGMIAGKFSVSQRARMRWLGYRKCLKDYGLVYDSKLVVQKAYTFREGKEAMANLLMLSKPPSAIFCGNDILAIGAIAGAKEKNLKIPWDISIVGFDDMEVSAYCDPPLTTIAVPAYEMGQMAAKVLIENLSGENKSPRQFVLETKLMIRGSAARNEKI